MHFTRTASHSRVTSAYVGTNTLCSRGFPFSQHFFFKFNDPVLWCRAVGAAQDSLRLTSQTTLPDAGRLRYLTLQRHFFFSLCSCRDRISTLWANRAQLRTIFLCTRQIPASLYITWIQQFCVLSARHFWWNPSYKAAMFSHLCDNFNALRQHAEGIDDHFIRY